MKSLSLPMPTHSSNHTGSPNTTVISTIQIKQNAAISFTHTNAHRTREQTSSWQSESHQVFRSILTILKMLQFLHLKIHIVKMY